ncbi:rCG37754 [Rattus norvegicus]|uniref:RCG37754 n=1 Tax=Rattus norvegicus TaxID=10116 RepID=A6JEY7_RAT|nr:rCG37754 [Rattus norvegicus]
MAEQRHQARVCSCYLLTNKEHSDIGVTKSIMK